MARSVGGLRAVGQLHEFREICQIFATNAYWIWGAVLAGTAAMRLNRAPNRWWAEEGVRQALFLGETVIKYHKTLTTYINALI
jgi:hypothetical protein